MSILRVREALNGGVHGVDSNPNKLTSKRIIYGNTAFEMVVVVCGMGYIILCTRKEVGDMESGPTSKRNALSVILRFIKAKTRQCLTFFVCHADVADGKSSFVHDNEFLCNNYDDRNLCQHFRTFKLFSKKKLAALVCSVAPRFFWRTLLKPMLRFFLWCILSLYAF